MHLPSREGSTVISRQFEKAVGRKSGVACGFITTAVKAWCEMEFCRALANRSVI